jgi:hypothetical protein
MSLQSITRSGKSLDDPTQSSLFARNPCPQKKFFAGLPADFTDDDKQRYWLSQHHEKLRKWYQESDLPRMLESSFDCMRDVVLYVDKADANKLTEFGAHTQQATCLQPGDSLQLKLSSPRTPYTCEVVAVGQRTVDASNHTRRIRWVHVRDLQAA